MEWLNTFRKTFFPNCKTDLQVQLIVIVSLLLSTRVKIRINFYGRNVKYWQEQIFPFTIALTLFRMGVLGAAHLCGGVGGKKNSENLSHIFYNDENWGSYTLPKEDPKNKQIT